MVPAGISLEVFNFDGITGVIVVDCVVTLGNDSELNLAEGTDLAFCTTVDGNGVCNGTFRDFTIMGGAAGFETEIQVKKNSIIQAGNFMITISGAEEAEAQFEEDFCLVLAGNLSITMNTGSDEGGDIQFKKVNPGGLAGTPCASPNIDVAGNITLTVSGADSEIQIEEDNDILAGGSITLTGNGEGSQVQTKKNVTLDATGGSISLTAPAFKGEVQVEENNDFDATVSITISSGLVGGEGKTEVKKFSVFTAPTKTVTVDAAGTCKVEDAVILTVDCSP